VTFGEGYASGKAVWRFASHRTPNSSMAYQDSWQYFAATLGMGLFRLEKLGLLLDGLVLKNMD
jgi:hypothetical protein